MLFNYFKIAFRNLVKYKGFSTINILGLAVGMASAILIFLWISHEVSYDQFHEKKTEFTKPGIRVVLMEKFPAGILLPKY